MRTGNRAADGAALLYVLTTSTAAAVFAASAASACPVAADLERSGIRFVGEDSDVIHRRLDAEQIEIDYVVDNAPLSRSVLAHGVYLVGYGDLDGGGEIAEGTSGSVTRPQTLSELPVPTPGLSWEGSYEFADSTGAYDESAAMSVGAPTQWNLGECSLSALMVRMAVSDSEGVSYTETMMYLPDLGTAVLVGVNDSNGDTEYVYTEVRVEEEK